MRYATKLFAATTIWVAVASPPALLAESLGAALATETDAIAAIEAAEVLELNDSPYGTGRAGPRNTGLFTTFDGGFSLAEINPHVSTDSGKTGDAVFMKFFNNDGSPATPPRAFIGDKKLRPLRIPRS